MTIPAAVIEALRGRQRNLPGHVHADRAVDRGDLRLLRQPYDSAPERRIGLVLQVNTSMHFVEIALVHPYAELATSMDGIVPAELTGTDFDVVVQSDLRGVAWTSVQVEQCVGRLSAATLEHVSDLLELGQSESRYGMRIGSRLAGPSDRRWDFKRSEGVALDLLTRDCASEVVDGRSPWRLEQELLVPQLLAQCADLDSVLVELSHWLATRDLRISIEDALELESLGALDLEAWERANLGALYGALIEVVERSMTTAASPPTGAVAQKTVVAPYSDRRTESRAVHVIGTLVGSTA